MKPRLYDAHNHLQDPRLGSVLESAMAAARNEGVVAMVVNGSCEEDWPAVLALSQRYPEVIPSFGYHPWYVGQRTGTWRETLAEFLDKTPAAIGEIGLDRWIKDFDMPVQEEVFLTQLRMAAERNLPVTIHCLKAWGRLHDLLKAESRPACGFVLHSFGGPMEMIPALANLGAYFSLPGYFAHERKARQREAFKRVPPERLLIETDAPDQLLPENKANYAAVAADGQPLNHPANIAAVYEFAAALLDRPMESLAEQVEANFTNLFGRLLRWAKPSSEW